MPQHSGPYWAVVWTLPITSIPRAKCSTWKLGQNGLIWPFLRSFRLFHEICSLFFICLDFYYQNWCQRVIYDCLDTCRAKARKKSGQIDLIWPDLRPKIHFKESKDLECRAKFFFFRIVMQGCIRVYFFCMGTLLDRATLISGQNGPIWPNKHVLSS